MVNKPVLKVLLVVQFIASLTIMLYVLAYSVPNTAISISKSNKLNGVFIFPQGWAFFTKSPKEGEYLLLKKISKHPFYEKEIPIGGSLHNFFGLNRHSRLKNQEFASLYRTIPEKEWVMLQGLIESNKDFIEKSKSYVIINKSKHPTIIGEFVFVYFEPIPWHWAKSFKIENQQFKFVNVNVIKDTNLLR